MPIYEYQCRVCGHTLEAFQSMSEDAFKICPKCDGETLDRLVSAAGFQLKGTGWYATDFKNSGNPKQADATKKPADNKQDAKNDKKPKETKASGE